LSSTARRCPTLFVTCVSTVPMSIRRKIIVLLFVLENVLQNVLALLTKEWKRRAIYQVITDRFAKQAHKPDTCDNLYDMGQKCEYGAYCGGTFAGIVEKLDYIQGMGFDAIWISPVVTNTACGYHGYWTQNFSNINEHFGGEKGLKALTDTAHSRGIAVMFDSVVNHVGPATVAAANADDYSMYAPFDKKEYFHGDYMKHERAEFAPVWNGQRMREIGWMGFSAELPDLAQERPKVAKILVDWVTDIRKKYEIDGFRIDAVPYTNKSFYQLLKKKALADIFTTGEVVVGGHINPANYQYQSPDAQGDDAADHVQGPVIDSVINARLNDALKHVFQVRDPFVDPGDMHAVDDKPYNQPVTYYVDEFLNATYNYKDVGALLNFISVHDQPRWMYLSPSWQSYQNALVATFFVPGIPINYYGDEQGVRGGNDDNTCRPPLWRTGYNESHHLYLFTKAVVFARKRMLQSLSDEEIDDLKHLAGTEYAMSFQRGSAVVIVEKEPPASDEKVINVATEYPKGTVLCDVLESSQSCVTVDERGIFRRIVSGSPKVFFEWQLRILMQ